MDARAKRVNTPYLSLTAGFSVPSARGQMVGLGGPEVYDVGILCAQTQP